MGGGAVESPLCEIAKSDGVRLIETLLWDGAQFPRLPGHMARLGQGAGVLGFPVDPATVLAALQAAGGPAPARVRLTLGASGDVAVTTADLPPARTEWRVGLAGVHLSSTDPWLAVKSTRRAQYDAARAGLGPGLDEVIFLNERDEVCDGTITTVFFDRGNGLRTPPLTSGLLPGVLRAGLLASGLCREEVLNRHDLGHVRLWVGNALRGRMRAVFE
jgi:4-amino-4-deoxychorismate lyase